MASSGIEVTVSLTEFEEHIYQYSPIRKHGPVSIRVMESITQGFVLRHPECRLESCIWDAIHMVVRVYWESPSMEALADWQFSFSQHGQPIPLLDIIEIED